MRSVIASVLCAVLVFLSWSFADSTPASAYTSQYSQTVLADAPDAYYRLGEASGTTATDSSGFARNATIYNGGGFRRAVGGAIGADADGAIYGDASSAFISDPQLIANPGLFTQEVWFKTTTSQGGRLIGFGTNDQNSSGSYDRMLWMDNAGRISFGTYNGGTKVITTPASYNDGNWHLATATLSASGMQLYIDGLSKITNASWTVAQNYSGFWKLGDDTLTGWSPLPTSSRFNGWLDEWAVWNTVALTPAQILAHYQAASASVGGLDFAVSVAPVFSFTVASAGSCASLTLTGTASATSVNLGRVTSTGTVTSAQALSVASNAGLGYVVSQRGAALSGSRAVATVSGTNAAPDVFGTGERFGYTTTGLAAFSGPKWAALAPTNASVALGATVTSGTSTCVAYQMTASPSTPAGNYSTTIFYTAAPTF